MISKATMWDKDLQLTKAISCWWHEERGQSSMIVRSFDSDIDVADWDHDKLQQAIADGFIKWGDADTVLEWYRTQELTEMPCLHKHCIIVGNKGTVTNTYFHSVAEYDYKEYVHNEKLESLVHEPVVWMYNGDIINEYQPFILIRELQDIFSNSCWDSNDPVVHVRMECPNGGTSIEGTITRVVLNESDFNPSITLYASPGDGIRFDAWVENEDE